ncbi:hypothetical protein BST36_29840 [Mycolicibacterium moriokaense]|nr:restriction endonuclease subunit S [Mycolicibacterium moriokaense]MCV7043060.1 restriction endonuclease subunit S [Mycolicibacterium moriokaense]ORB12842.1 hypothetical protein BST36_29840 [Mycolicibacterium moriokaense]
MLDAGREADPSARELPYIRAGNIQDTGLDLSSVNTMPFTECEAATLNLRRGDVLVVEGGAVGTCVVLDSDLPGWSFQKTVNRVRPVGDSSSQYLAYVLRAYRDAGIIDIVCNKSTIPHLTAEKLRALRIPSWAPGVQRAIADYLDRVTGRIDMLIAEQQKLIKLLGERRQALIEKRVACGLDDRTSFKTSTLAWTEKVPTHWRVANIRRFAQMKTGHTPSRSVPEYWENCTIPWFTLADVWQLRDSRRMYLGETSSLISEDGLANSAAELLPAGTVVLSRTASVGFAGIMPTAMATSQDFWNWMCGPELEPAYLVYVFRAMRNEFQALMIGSTHKTIYQPVAAAMRIPVPPLDEQRGIVAHLDEQTARIDTLIAESERFIELARERRAALITAAVTGQIDVREVA